MKKSIIYLVAAITTVSVVLSLFAGQTDENMPSKSPRVHFKPIAVYIDSGAESLAAYQFELTTKTGQVKIVGVEGGEHAAFANPPYYDPAALQHDRIIIAAFNTSKDLPKGKTRVATLHMQITGDTEPQYEIKLTATANPDGKKILCEVTITEGEQK